MSKLIATDLDGTLFYPKHRIIMVSNKSLKLLRKQIDDGNKVVIISGRNRGYMSKVAAKIGRPIDYITCNGTRIYHDNECISHKKFDVEKLKEALKYIEDTYHPLGFFVMSEDDEFVLRNKFKSIFYRIGYLFWYFFQGVYREKFILNTKKFDEIIEKNKANKIMIMFGIKQKDIERCKEANKEIYEKYKGFIEPSWSNEFIEITPPGTNKSEGLKIYSNYLNIKPDDIYVIGDSGNDISMFKDFSKNSFCLSHAPLSVSKYAKHTIEKFEDLEKYL